jgi:hypothetical protein
LEKVEKLRRAIDANPAGFPQTLRFLRRAGQAIRTSTMPSPPPAASHPYLSTLGRDDAQAELATVGSHILEAFVVAVQDTARLDPDAFGDATDLAAYKKQFEDLQVRRQQLFQRIGTEFTVADLAFERWDATPTFRIATGIVPIGPQENAGERLVNWICVTPDALQALGVKP